MKKRAECGTISGCTSHYYHQEKPCDACRAAQAAYMRAYRKRKKAEVLDESVRGRV